MDAWIERAWEILEDPSSPEAWAERAGEILRDGI